ncbi:hypothetical protein [Pseudonocardia sp. KRD291]|uniref:hypothetical protein n=1 Tax=Pseudonocardia sp. KRD291 TaxID=2792007 RepID=UPI001C4A47BC|nr:hypothetical protein [Pseudonocardia sp. KRD291]
MRRPRDTSRPRATVTSPNWGVKVDANRSAINALGVQTAERFDQVDRQFEQVDRNFAEIRGRLDQTAAGQQQIADMLTTLIERQDGQ